MADIGFSGLASGLDTSTLITKLMQIERQPITKMQSQIAKNNTAMERLRLLTTRMNALSNAAQKLIGTSGESSSPLQGRVTTISDPTVLTLVAAGGAPVGTYTVQVNALASPAALTGAVTARSATSAVGGGNGTNTYRITDGTNSFQFTLSKSTSLQGLVNAINSSASSPVTAAVANSTGTTSSLSLTSKTAGTAGNFRVEWVSSSQGTATEDLSGAPHMATIGLSPIDVAGIATAYSSPATNASITVNGVTVTNTTNTFIDAIPGTTLTALKAGPTVVTTTVDLDIAGATAAVQDFISKYNEIITQVREDTKYDPTTKKAGPLRLTTGVRELSVTLNRMVTDEFDYSGANGSFNNYKDVGISVNRDGTLSIDEKVLKEAISTNAGSLYQLLAREDNVMDASGQVRMNQGGNQATSSMGDGIATRLKALASSLTEQGSLWNGVGPNGSRLTGGILLNINTLTTTNSRLNARIDVEEVRVSKRQKALQLQFQNMEKVISGLKTQGNYLTNQFNGSSGG